MFGAEVRQPNGSQELAYLVFILEVQVFNLEPFLVAQCIEVLERQNADVRRVVPFVGEFFGNWHAAVEHQASASRPVSKIRERDNDLFRHAQQLVQKGDRVADFLNRAVDDGVVKAAVLDVLESAFVQVSLDNLYIVFETVEDALDILFYAESCDVLFVDKIIQQVAAAATEVEHMAPFFHQFANKCKVALVMEYGDGLRPFLRDNLGIEESAYSLAEFADFDQESVVAKLRVEFEARD